jgi:hypothetical protein
MKRSALALGIGASMGIAAMVAATGLRPKAEVAADMARSVVAGVILGSHAWPYDWNVPAADYQSRLELWSSLCGWQGRCDGDGLATVGFGDSDQEPVIDKTEGATPTPYTGP